jgi:hypothetical protein
MLCASWVCSAPALADAVTDWNDIAVVAVTAGRPGPIGVVDLALVQAAVHDAVQALDHRFEPYYSEVPGATGSRSAAVAAAAHAVLVGMYPSQAATLDPTYFNYLAANGLAGDPGLAVGEAVAAEIMPLRRVNPPPPVPVFDGSPVGIGRWRPTPTAFATMASPWAGSYDPFTLTGPARFRAPPPPALTSTRYARDYNEVKALGAATGSSRTAEQTDIGYFYSENFLAQYNRALRAIASQHIKRIGDSARLFALANLSMADAFITAWDSKIFYNLWRPSTAINEGEFDGNPNTAGDPAWAPLILNPPYPDYTSGANNLTGAVTKTLELYFNRDKFTWEVTSNAPLAVKKSRTYYRFSDVAADVVSARVYLGIHFRFADKEARTQGRNVATWVQEHFLLPRHDGHKDHKNGDDHDD